MIEVRFKGNRKDYYSWDDATPLTVGAAVVVEAERGLDLGVVSAVGAAAERKCGVGCSGCALGQPREPRGKVVRPAASEETRVRDELREAEEDVRRKVLERVRSHGLSMKVSDAEWQWDRKKLTIYFTAEQRVDFRSLVRDLAGLFRTRIDLRQIGARDEAKRLDGVGRCGRQFCCSSWLPELRPVSLALAKDQRLSLNPAQISGGCGRLLCCLRYEHDFYVASRQRFPKEGKTLQTPRGPERVHAVDIFRERVLLKAQDGSTRTVGLLELQTELAAHGATLEPEPAAAPPPTEPTTSVELESAEGETPSGPLPGTEEPPERRRHRRRRRGRRSGRRRAKPDPGGATQDGDPPGE